MTISASVLDELNDPRICAGNLVEGLSSDQLVQRPEPTKWSVAECLAHSNKTADVVQRMMTKSIDRGKERRVFDKGPFSSWPQRQIADLDRVASAEISSSRTQGSGAAGHHK